MPRKLKPRTRGSGVYTEAGYWGFIRSLLRRGSSKWPPIRNTRTKARRRYKGKDKRRKWEYVCAHCGKGFRNDEVKVDHITPVGSLRCAEDLPRFVTTMYCEEDNLQVLCDPCHKIKGEEDKARR